jgi:hypothetical protein
MEKRGLRSERDEAGQDETTTKDETDGENRGQCDGLRSAHVNAWPRRVGNEGRRRPRTTKRIGRIRNHFSLFK